jgi:hypothetical protein
LCKFIIFTNRATISTKEFPDGEIIRRKFTPTSPILQKGSFDLLIKVYHKTEQFPDGGILTLWLDQIEIGTYLKMKGPIGRFFYYGNGRFKLG